MTIKMMLWKRAPENPDLFCPIYVCDVCDKPIVQVNLALYAWGQRTGEQIEDTTHIIPTDFVMVHKGKCMWTYESRLGPHAQAMCVELHDLFPALVENAGGGRSEPAFRDALIACGGVESML